MISALFTKIINKWVNDSLSNFSFRQSSSIFPVSQFYIAIYSEHDNFVLLLCHKLCILIILRYFIESGYFQSTVNWFSLPFVLFRFVEGNRTFLCPYHDTFTHPAQRSSQSNCLGIIENNVEFGVPIHRQIRSCNNDILRLWSTTKAIHNIGDSCDGGR